MFSKKKKKEAPPAQVASGFDVEEDRPSNGDNILLCGHLEGTDKTTRHWHKLPEPMRFARPDRTTGLAKFVSLCTACHVSSRGDFTKMKIQGDSIWRDDRELPEEHLR